jgi:hypothetical protein
MHIAGERRGGGGHLRYRLKNFEKLDHKNAIKVKTQK